MRLITRSPWTRQPQVPVGLSFRNALSFNAAVKTLQTSITGDLRGGYFGIGASKVGVAGAAATSAVNFKLSSGTADFLVIAAVNNLYGSYTPGSLSIFSSLGDGYNGGIQLGSYYAQASFGVFQTYSGVTAANSAVTKNRPAVLVGRRVGVNLDLFIKVLGEAPTKTSATDTVVRNVQANGSASFSIGGNNSVAALHVLEGFFSDSQIYGFLDNPWQLFEPIQRTIWVPAAAGGVSGTLATTNANDTSAATGTTTVTGTLAKTNANDTSSASGTTTVTGTLATTNANDSVTASGDVGGNITGTVNYTNANDTSAASGTTTVTGSLAKTNANDSVSASGTTTVTGSLARTNANDSVVASGAAGTVTGTVNVTNSNDTADAYGIGAPNNDSGDGSMSRKRYYLRRKGKILLFDTAAQADDYIEAEEEAQKAIAAAKSRGAKKRIAAKILKAVEPIESVEIAPLQELVKAYSMPVNLPQLLSQQDYQQVMDVRAMIQRIQDDEDDELLLLLA